MLQNPLKNWVSSYIIGLYKIWRYLIENIRKDFRLHDFPKEKETATIRNAMYSGQLQAGNATIWKFQTVT